MKIVFECENCGSEFTVDAQLGGRTGRCKHCGHRLVIPTVTAGNAKAGPVLAGMRRSASGNRGPGLPDQEKGGTAVAEAPARSSPTKAAGGLSAVSNIGLKPISEERMPAVRRESSPKAAVRSARVTASGSGARPISWQEAVTSQVGLKPISVERLPTLQRMHEEEEWEDSSPYGLAKPIPPDEKPRRAKRGPGVVTNSYRRVFRKTGQTLRWINETAYGISILFLMMACVGYAMQVYENANPPSLVQDKSSQGPPQARPIQGLAKIETELAQADLPVQSQSVPDDQPEASQAPPPRHARAAPPVKQNKWTIIGITGIVVLNLIRFIVGAANLVVIPFRQSPMQGVLFLIPPITFFYLRSHWNKVRKPVHRITGPMIALGLVVLAYAFLPGLSHASRTSGTLQHRIEASVDILKGDVTRQVDRTKGDVNTLKGNLERRLPGDLEKAKTAAEKLGSRVRQNVNDLKEQLPGKVEEAKKAGQSLQGRLRQAVESSGAPSPDASHEGQTPPKSAEEAR